MSKNGQFVAVSTNGFGVVTSNDYARTWTHRNSSIINGILLSDIASDSTGNRLVVVGFGKRVFVSSDFGVSWDYSLISSTISATTQWRSVSSDITGQYLIACASDYLPQNLPLVPINPNGMVYVSSNYGTSWADTSKNSMLAYTSVVSDSTGQYVAVSTAATSSSTSSSYSFGCVYRSSNYGVKWVTSLCDSGYSYFSLASNGNGTQLAVSYTPFNHVATAYINRTSSRKDTWVHFNNPPPDQCQLSDGNSFFYSYFADVAMSFNGSVYVAAYGNYAAELGGYSDKYDTGKEFCGGVFYQCSTSFYNYYHHSYHVDSTITLISSIVTFALALLYGSEILKRCMQRSVKKTNRRDRSNNFEVDFKIDAKLLSNEINNMSGHEDERKMRGQRLKEFFETFIDQRSLDPVTKSVKSPLAEVFDAFCKLITCRIGWQEFFSVDFFTFWVSTLFTTSGLLCSPLTPPLAIGFGLLLVVWSITLKMFNLIDFLFFLVLLWIGVSHLLFGISVLGGYKELFVRKFKYNGLSDLFSPEFYKTLFYWILMNSGLPAYIIIMITMSLRYFGLYQFNYADFSYADVNTATESRTAASTDVAVMMLLMCVGVYVFSFKRKYAFIVFLAEWLILCVMWAVELHSGINFKHSLLLEYCFISWITLPGCLLILVLFLRRRTMIYARSFGGEDAVKYAATWSDISAVQSIELQELGNAWQTLIKPASRSPTSQADTLSIEELFDQADLTNPLLHEKACQWAQRNGSVYPINPAPVKDVHRATEKVYRCYGGDYFKLCDLVRCSIVFSTVTSLTRCLKDIASDKEVQIVYRGDSKFRLRDTFNAADTLGYRDIQLTIQIVHERAQELKVESHLCEVQLHLASLVALKNDKGHQNYRKMRILKAE